jgi:hypothetical protein
VVVPNAPAVAAFNTPTPTFIVRAYTGFSANEIAINYIL